MGKEETAKVDGCEKKERMEGEDEVEVLKVGTYSEEHKLHTH